MPIVGYFAGIKRNVHLFENCGRSIFDNSLCGFGIEDCRVVRDVAVLILGHLRQGVIRLQDGQGLAEELQCFLLEQVAKNRERKTMI